MLPKWRPVSSCRMVPCADPSGHLSANCRWGDPSDPLGIDVLTHLFQAVTPCFSHTNKTEEEDLSRTPMAPVWANSHCFNGDCFCSPAASPGPFCVTGTILLSHPQLERLPSDASFQRHQAASPRRSPDPPGLRDNYFNALWQRLSFCSGRVG